MLYLFFFVDLWSAKVDLPVRGDDLKVCAYKNQLFLLSVPCARAYLFNPKTKYFAKIELGSEVAVALMESFAMFNYREEIYFKGTQSKCILFLQEPNVL